MKTRGFVREFAIAAVTAIAVALGYFLGLRSLPSPLLIVAAVLLGVLSMFRETPGELQVALLACATTMIALLAWVH